MINCFSGFFFSVPVCGEDFGGSLTAAAAVFFGNFFATSSASLIRSSLTASASSAVSPSVIPTVAWIFLGRGVAFAGAFVNAGLPNPFGLGLS